MSMTSPDEADELKVLILTIEDFGRHHPQLNPDLLIERTRVALSRYHKSPASFKLIGPPGEFTSTIHFGAPDSRSVNTFERERCVEEGAILLGAMLVAELETKRITRVVPRRGRADYFLESHNDPGYWLLEVSGTDKGDIQARTRIKMQQLRSTPYRCEPGFRGGYVAVTRFAPPACSLLEAWIFEAGRL
jgi:hypothetical protein